MKKTIATLLSVCMAFSILAQTPAAYAEETSQAQARPTEPLRQEPAQTPETGAVPQEPGAESLREATEPAPQEETGTAAGDTASVEVILLTGAPMQTGVAFRVELTDERQQSAGVRTCVLPPAGTNDPGRVSALFEGLALGSYTLTVTGGGFATYTQVIPVERQGTAYGVQLYTGFLASYHYTDDSRHPGVLRPGDVTGDGSIGRDDALMLIDVLAGQTDDVRGDLNGDGTVDLADLQMLAVHLDDTRDTRSAVSAGVSRALTRTQQGSDTQVAAGSLEDLLQGENTVSLRSASSQIIDGDHPVTLDFAFAAAAEAAVEMEGMVVQTPAGSENAVSAATVTVEYLADGRIETRDFPVVSARSRAAGAVIQPDGSVVIHFGGQIAVKKVSIKVTATANRTNLAEITRVEFLNDMESRIPPPQMDVPGNLAAVPGSRTFTLTWDAAVNVTGYEVCIRQGDRQQTLPVAANTVTVNLFDGEKLNNGTVYTAQVQSVNGAWRSGYGPSVEVTPKADKLPPAPDALTLTGRFQRIEASWAKMKDTDGYNLYIRKAGEPVFRKIENIPDPRYTVQNLENQVRYEVYVTGVNELGEGPASLIASAVTAGVSPVGMPAYGLINTPETAGQATAHIVEVTHEAGYMKDSPLDAGKSAWGVVDNDFASWYGLDDWDDGASWPDNGGVRVTFDGQYRIGSISLAQAEDRSAYGCARVFARGADGREKELPGVSIARRSDGARNYYTIKIPGGVETDYLRVCVGYTYWDSPVSISEMRFYNYDSLEDEILALYADDLHLTLRPGTDEGTIQALQQRLDTPDETSGELHPDRAALQRELDNARGLLDAELRQVVQVHTGITAKRDGHLGFTGLNAWQPLGVTAHADEELIVYVGGGTGAAGTAASLQMVATQYNGESGQVVSKPIALKVGRNEVTIPALVSFEAEHGGALYVQYTGNNPQDRYSVRVSGGAAIPVLDLYGVDEGEERLARATAYVQALEARAAELETLHEAGHGGSGLSAVDHAYNPEECILNTTDVLLNQMMLSVPATQVLAGLGSGSTAEKAARLLRSMDAMDQMMELFYQHKGLTDLEGAGDDNRLPAQHLNIRYMRMFAGAFMYAAGNHIGIGWDSVPGLARGTPVSVSGTGAYLSGDYFGWGIAHEIGHNINQSSYAVAEVTNNYFAQLSQAHEGVRFGYDAIYRKVTSGALGVSEDVFTQLAMYWQLQLAYDKGYPYQIYDSYGQLFESRFFARVDTYARTPSAAPAPGGVALTLGGDAAQNFMRLAGAAAQRDLTEFFGRWGLVPDAATAAYMAQFEPESRAVYYTNDDARDYAFTHGDAAGFAGQAVLTDGTTAVVDDHIPNQVNLTLASRADRDLVLGYEISRVTWENGKAQTRVVGFATGDTYADTITTVNHRTVGYVVTAVDKFLNRSVSMTLPAVKICHDGDHGKSLWTVTTNMISAEDMTPGAGEQDPCEPKPVSAVQRIIDNNRGTTYTGRAASGQAAVTLDFHQTLAVAGFRYTVTEGVPIERYEVQLHTGGGWKTLASGTFSGQEVDTVYFRNENLDPWVCTYDADRLRLVVTAPAGTDISISELDVLGPTGDNVELLAEGIGILREAYPFDAGAGEAGVIPAGSLVFTGRYKGNPAYNVVLLYDRDGSIVGGVDAEGNLVADQIILAEVPEQGELGEVSAGSWIYWIEPDALENVPLPETVRVELYRVDNAVTNEGQRLTADTLPLTLPERLPQITLSAESTH